VLFCAEGTNFLSFCTCSLLHTVQKMTSCGRLGRRSDKSYQLQYRYACVLLMKLSVSKMPLRPHTDRYCECVFCYFPCALSFRVQTAEFVSVERLLALSHRIWSRCAKTDRLFGTSVTTLLDQEKHG
jgi:hypothetical protein